MNELGERVRPDRHQWPWSLVAIFLVAMVLRVAFLDRQCLWPDEIFSLAIATGHSLEHPATAANPSLGDFVEPAYPAQREEFVRYVRQENPPASPARVLRAAFLSDTSPPLYYLSLHVWTLLLGTSGAALRLFSVACSLGCLPLIGEVARRTGGIKAVFPAYALFVFSPLAIYYSTEGRMYSLLWLCVLATTLLSIILHQRGGNIAFAILWVTASAAGFLTHYFFLFPWMAMVALLMISPGKLRRSILLLCLIGTAAIILPWYLKLPENLHNWRVTQGWLAMRPQDFDSLAAFRLITQFFSGHERHLWPSSRLPSSVALLLFCIALAVMTWRLRSHLANFRLVVLWFSFLAVCAGPMVIDLVGHTYTIAVSRYAIAALPTAYLLAASALACMRRSTRTVLLALILAAWIPHLWSLYSSRSRNGSSICEVARAASIGAQPSDLILVHSIPSGVIGVAYYATGTTPIASWIGQLGMRKVPESIRTLAAGRTRIIFVDVHDAGEPAPEEKWLRANTIAEKRPNRTAVTDFRPIDAPTF